MRKASASAKAPEPVPSSRFDGTPGEIVSLEGLNLDFSARVRKSLYDELLDKLAAAPKDSAIRFGSVKCRTSVAVRAKKRGYAVQFSESGGGALFVRIVANKAEDLKEERRHRITVILKNGPLTYLKITNRLRELGDELVDGATVERILTQMRKTGDVIVQEGGSYAIAPTKAAARV